ncbi:MAG: hypothetical protein HY783_01765 [Chloroflexi bacterium]|nr:hypothetical protein [Chloroflexota bacterium]
MRKRISMGKCGLCGGTFSKAAMTKHLDLCRQKQVPQTPSGGRVVRKTKVFRIVVEGRHLPEYWMDVEAPANATLEDLDDFLRGAWLECCGHMSAFTIEGKTYTSGPRGWSEGEGMDVALGKVLRPGMKFYHEYDFGTTTELTLRVMPERESEIKGKPIQLLARNDPPSITCESCGKIATQVCSECIWSGEGWLCDECAGGHKCGEEMLLPVVNSPRVGMCGYTG